jgi:hypothetical protein
MAQGYRKLLCLLAFDHRGSFEPYLSGAPHPVPDEVRARTTDAKEVTRGRSAGVHEIAGHYLEVASGFASNS